MRPRIKIQYPMKNRDKDEVKYYRKQERNHAVYPSVAIV